MTLGRLAGFVPRGGDQFQLLACLPAAGLCADAPFRP
jgi:hypothetical protein